MSTDLFLNYNVFNPSNDVKYNKPRINKSGGKSIGILNKFTNRQLNLNTPLLLTWGLNERVDEKSGRVSYDMALQFPNGEYHNEQTKKFLDTMIEFESEVKRQAIQNSKQWLNMAKLTDGQVDVLFHPMLYFPRNKETGELDPTRSPTLKVKLDFWDEKFNCEIYDVRQKLLFPNQDDSVRPLDLLTKASNVACIIKCGGVWFANGKFGVTWKLVQAVVKPKASLSGKCFIELTSEEKSKLSEQTNGSDEDENKEKSVNVSDSSSESSSEDEAEAEAEAEAEVVAVANVVVEEEKPKRRVVNRKKRVN
jgi:hypothetical protein